MHPVSVSVYDLAGRRKIRRKRGSEEVGTLLCHESTPQMLSYFVKLHDHPEVSSVRGQVLPDLGLQVARFDYLEPRPLSADYVSADFDYYLDIVRVTEQGKRWVVRDLYLDVLVVEGVRATILDTDEYLAAVREGHLGADEAAYALGAAHALLNNLAKFGYSLAAYLHSEGVTLTWPKSKSTH